MATLPALRRFAYAALLVALAHLVFGAIVRISGSGMGCGDHWPLCYGRLFPPMDRPDLVVEWTHRLLASILVVTVASFAVVAWVCRSEPRVGGPGGVLRAALLAVIACRSFPLCGADPAAGAGAVHVQLTHRLLAFLLLLHLIGVVRGFWRRRDESRTVARAATIALGLVFLQFIVAASMVLLTLPAVLRSLHEAVGVSVWLATFTYAYLARVAAGRAGATRAMSLGDVP